MPFGVGLTGIVAALAIAWWQYRRAERMNGVLLSASEEIPAKVAEATRILIRSIQRESASDSRLLAMWPKIDCIDVDGDGKTELTVQYPSGAHGSALMIFGWPYGRFSQKAYLDTPTAVGFEFGDFDGDGKLEVRTEVTDSSAGLPYATAPRSVLLLRWNGADFVEVSRQRAPNTDLTTNV